MTNEEIISKIITSLNEEFEIDVELIRPDGLLIETLDLDSLDMVDMVVLIERDFGFHMKKQDFARIKTFQDFYDFVIGRMKQQ
jgi:acyl carrier protein